MAIGGFESERYQPRLHASRQEQRLESLPLRIRVGRRGFSPFQLGKLLLKFISARLFPIFGRV